MSDVAPSTGPGPAEAAAPKSGHPREGPFGTVPADARLTYAWAAPFVQVAIYVVSVVPALIVTAIALAPFLADMGAGAIADGALPPELELPALLIAVAVQFPIWALLIALWVRAFERRSLASAGFRGPSPLRRYGVGLLAGFAIAAALALLSVFVAPEAAVDVDIESFDPGRVLEAPWLLTMLGVTVLFLVQGACEEIAFRGWMMSAVAARRGLVLGVAVNIAVFGALHLQVLASGALAGGAAIAAITGVGLFLSLWAIAERSIAGVCGVHGAFNATLVVLGLIAGGATDPDATPGQVLLDTIKEATALEGDASVAGALLQLVVFAALSGLIWRWLRQRR